MKTSLIAVFCFCSTIIFAQPNVPQRVVSNFNAKFPAAQSLRWSAESESKNYIASFYMQDLEKRACFDDKGIWLYTSTMLDDRELPENVADEISNNYINAIVLFSEYRITHKGDKVYIIKIQTENDDFLLDEEEQDDAVENERGPAYLLTFDPEGKLITVKEVINIP
ncbi:hypothetical protein C900_03849 [Fulvivirga imtechensis AK7]|uniref:Putative beta-lactamase-inhibitor-like PepSY-like domain-containing protein n=1 Tax=Fulvivirga imtechensis AK7 TaxID=1237149 RepID=L8JRQ5_9BACT|nr:PepSY-like domain-containing protein [Fulvivirga imtechensis]ELR70164.1 hypothetical protein C900_03849 [Fulvivirga imtechensis AK7]